MTNKSLKAEPFIISVVATKSGTGKTTLIESMVRILKSRGYTVGVLKHNVHRLIMDKEGKDSYRFSDAGADNVIVSSSTKLVMIKALKERESVENIIKMFGNMDIIFIEGFKDNKFSKIEVHRRGVDTRLLMDSWDFNKDTFIALASDEALDKCIPVLDLNDYEAIADFIENIKMFQGR
ncbi:MAG: molybdopterin-guanine dinucleotide biosynthesis protein B [Solirubrobacterales bacterium]